MLYCIEVYFIELHFIKIHCVELHFIVLHCIALHCFALWTHALTKLTRSGTHVKNQRVRLRREDMHTDKRGQVLWEDDGRQEVIERWSMVEHVVVYFHAYPLPSRQGLVEEVKK